MKLTGRIKFGQLLTLCSFFVVLSTVVFCYALPLRGGDIWFHLLYGKHFFENLTVIPDHSQYSWTPATNAVIYCTWVPDLIIFIVFSLGGLPALFLFRYVCIFFFVLAAMLYAKQLKLLHHPLTWLLILLTVLMADAAILIKPEIITFVLMTALTWTWWSIKASPTNTWKYCYLFPCFMLFWVNSHGGVIFGYVFLVCLMGGELLNLLFESSPLPPRTRKHFFLAFFLSLFMLLATPYGYHYPLQLLQDIIPTSSNLEYNRYITAYFSPMVVDPNRLDNVDLANIAFVLLVLTALSLIRSRRIDFTFLSANIVFAFLYTCFYRTTFYWAPVYLFSMLFLLHGKPAFLFPEKRITQIFQTCCFMTIFIFLSVHALYDTACLPKPYMHSGFGKGDSVPEHETRFIKDNFPGYNIGNTYNQGSYLLWELWPKNMVMIDSRHFPYRSWSSDLFKFAQDPWKNSNFPSKYSSDIWCVGFQRPQLCLWFIQSPDWNLAYYGKNAAIFVRRHIPVPRSLPESQHNVFKSINNHYTALTTLRFAITLQDWHIADIILDRMKVIATCRISKEIRHSATLFTEAYRAYFSGEYLQTIKLLEDRHVNTFLTNQDMLSFSYSHLANNSWLDGKNEKALEYSIKALQAAGTPYSFFNYGVIQGYLAQTDKQVSGGEDQLDWQLALQESLRQSLSEPELAPIIQSQAIGILQSGFIERPALIVPPAGEIRSSGSIAMSKL